MGIDLYLLPQDGKHEDEVGACSRNLASEIDTLIELGKGTLVSFVSGDDDCKYHDPAKLLTAVEKTIKLASALDDSAFVVDKQACIDELEALREPLQKAVKYKVKVCVNIS